MGFWSSVCSAVSSVCSVISSAVSKVGDVIATAATSIARLGVELAARVGDTIKSVGVLLGIISPEEKLDELGEKAMLSDKKPEDFDSFNEYIDHLRNNVQIDKEKFSKLDEKELLARASIGASITLQGINEKLNTVVTPEFLSVVAQQELEAKEIVSTIEIYKEKNLNIDDYALYINDELDLDETSKHSNALVQAYQKLEPELTLRQIEEKVMELKS